MFSKLLRHTIKNLPMPEPLVPEGRTVNIPAEDTNETTNTDAENTISTALFISYKNSKGEISNRRISVKKIFRNDSGKTMIGAYCFEKKTYRTFRADRIIEAIDMATGEIIDNKETILECFGSIAPAEETNPRSATSKALKKCRHVLNVLIYLARCDGHFHQEEENVLIHYIMEQCFDYNFDDKYLVSRIRGMYPDTDTFFDSLDYLEENTPDHLNKLGRYAAQLVQADGIIAESEINFMNELQAYINP